MGKPPLERPHCHGEVRARGRSLRRFIHNWRHRVANSIFADIDMPENCETIELRGLNLWPAALYIGRLSKRHPADGPLLHFAGSKFSCDPCFVSFFAFVCSAALVVSVWLRGGIFDAGLENLRGVGILRGSAVDFICNDEHVAGAGPFSGRHPQPCTPDPEREPAVRASESDRHPGCTLAGERTSCWASSRGPSIDMRGMRPRTMATSSQR